MTVITAHQLPGEPNRRVEGNKNDRQWWPCVDSEALTPAVQRGKLEID